MALDFKNSTFTKAGEQAATDVGLRAYMLKVYNYMTTALLLTGIVAYVFGKASIITNEYGQIVNLTAIGNMLFNSPLQWVVMLAPLGLVFYFSFRINKMSLSGAQLTFWIFLLLLSSHRS